MTSKLHYHVYDHLLGCLPDGDGELDEFSAKKEAEAFCARLAQDYRDSGYDVTGNARIGYSIGETRSLYVEACQHCEDTAEERF